MHKQCAVRNTLRWCQLDFSDSERTPRAGCCEFEWNLWMWMVTI